MVEDNRLSLHSGISQFSFEHNHEDLIQPFTTTAVSVQSLDRVPSPPRSPNKLDVLLRENIELKKRTSEQSQLINSLKYQIYELKQALGNNKDEDKNNREEQSPPTIGPDAASSPVRDEPEVNLTLPPRSSNRSRTKPTPLIIESVAETNNEEPEDLDTTLNKEDADIHTPSRGTPDVDWNATLAALNASIDSDSNEEEEEEKEEESSKQETEQIKEPIEREIPKVVIRPGSKQSTPYSGRIQNSGSSTTSPTRSVYSPIKSQFGSIDGNHTPGSNLSINSHTPSFTQESSSDEQKGISTSNGSVLLSTSNSRQNLISPLRSTFQRPPISTPKNNHIDISDSTPATPMTSHSIASNQPLSKFNVYDPYTADFQNQQQVIQDTNRLVGPFSNNNSPYPQAHQPYNSSYPPQSSHGQVAPTFPTDVPLFVEPHLLSSIKPDVVTTIYGNPSKKSENPTVIFSANDRATKKEMWRFKKTLSQIVLLDNEIRPLINSFSLPPIPEKSLFLTNIPSKIDLRRMRIKDYFLTLFNIPNIPLEVAYKVARFMSLDVVNLLDESNTEALKDGWLLRRAKGLGNSWKARYCETDGSFINVFESAGGSLLEIIKLTGSQIGRQPDTSSKDDKSSYRHAFAVMESKKGLKSNQFTKHIFCAETDEERDAWVNVLVQFTDDSTYSDVATLSSQTVLGSELSIKSPLPSPSRHARDISRSGEDDFSEDSSILNESIRDSKRNKKRSFFPFGKKQLNYEDNESIKNEPLEESNIEKSLQNLNLAPVITNRTIFQNEIDQVKNLSTKTLYGQEVPSIVYRCLKYLIDKKAIYEEGIFRLSGSAALIKQLKETFDRDYDIDFDQYEPKPDINTIAGLLKLWFRELPSSILTKELLAQYKAYYNNSNGDSQQLAIIFKNLTQRLPASNQSVLYVLFKFLNEVVQNKDLNKMNLRNLCIVFSPTLNLSSELVVPFLVDFKCIFENGEPIKNEDREILDVKIPTF